MPQSNDQARRHLIAPPTEQQLEELHQLVVEITAQNQRRRLALRARAELELRRRRRALAATEGDRT
jgi:hypothetical protein